MATRVLCDDSYPDTVHSTLSSGHGTVLQSHHPHKRTNKNCYRRRLLKRLKEKLQSPVQDGTLSEDPYALTTRPTVIRVGTMSSCASSTVRSRTSTVGSWRWDELFGRGTSVVSSTPTCPSTISSMRSGRSNKTIIYDDRWLEVDKPDFCTVVAVNDGGGGGCIVLVNAQDETVDLEPSTSSSEAEIVGTSGTTDSCTCSNNSTSSGHCSTAGCSTSNTCSNSNSTSKMLDQPTPGAAIDPALPNPAMIFAPVPPQSTLGAWTAPNHYHRLNNASEPPMGSNSIGNGGGDLPFDMCRQGGGHGQHLLAPEDLPRMFPPNAWQSGVGQIRFEEQIEEETKGCCGTGRESQSTFVRWFVGIISVIGLSCVIVGIVLGALIVSGSTRLTLCLLMIGVGLVLITVSGIAWRLTTFESDGCLNSDCLLSTCCLEFCGLRSAAERRRLRRAAIVLPGQFHSSVAYARVRSFHRPPQPPPPQMACIPPEFIWRPPPPSYHASMQEERMQSLFGYPRPTEDLNTSIGSPPPTYRSYNEEAHRRQSVAQMVHVAARASDNRSDDNQNSNSSVLSSDHSSSASGDMQVENASTAAPDAVLAPEPVQHDEGASLVMNEQLQQTASLTSPDPISSMDPSPPAQFRGGQRIRLRSAVRTLPWPPPMAPLPVRMVHRAGMVQRMPPVSVMQAHQASGHAQGRIQGEGFAARNSAGHM